MLREREAVETKLLNIELMLLVMPYASNSCHRKHAHTHIPALHQHFTSATTGTQTYQSLAMLYAYKTNACFRSLQFPPSQAAKASVMQQLQYGINSLSKFAIARVLILADI